MKSFAAEKMKRNTKTHKFERWLAAEIMKEMKSNIETHNF